MDRRSREARILAGTKAELTAHVGGKPSATQQALIDRAAWLTLHVAQIDAKAARDGVLTEHDAKMYLAWSNTLTRALKALSLKSAPEHVPSLAEHLAASRGIAA